MNRRMFAIFATSLFLALTLIGCDLKVKDVRLDTGVTLNYAEQGFKHGPTVIFLHGYTDSWFSFSRVLPLLPLDIHAYALSQRGHGDSEKPDCCYEQFNFTEDVASFMDKKGIDQAVIVGHSMGSLVAHKFAVDYPDRVSKLVLIGSTPTMNGNAGFQDFLDYINAEPDVVNDPAFVRNFQESTIYTGPGANPVPSEFLDTIIEESLKVEFPAWQGALQGLLNENHVDQLSSISCPTLILYGANDAIFSAEEQDALVDAIPNATLNVFENTGHAPHWERPAAVAAQLINFID